jgi:hypothetical protein
MKKNGILNLFIILVTLTLVSCVDAGSGGKRKNGSSTSGATSSDTPTDSNPTETLDAYWYFNGQKIPGAMTINQDMQSVAYFRGNTVNSFLNSNDNFSKLYCMAISLKGSGATSEILKVRAVPISITNFSTNSVEKLLRVDLIEDSINSNQCAGSVSALDSQERSNGVPSPAATSYSVATTCTNCFNSFTSTNISLYEVQSGTISDLTKVPNPTSGFSQTNLTINPSNLSGDPVGTCSNSECSAKGFDCCLNGQCVKDAAVKPNVLTTSPEYIQAEAEVAIDPLNFLKWPNVYFICPNIVRPTPTPDEPIDPAVPAEEEFQALLKQYNCLEGAKEDSPDYSACEPTFDLAAYDVIKEDVWDKCGCEAVGADRAVKCPDFGLKPTKDVNDVIVAITCDIPQPPSGPKPTQHLNVPVSVRSIPHRFYDTTGKRWDSVEEIKDATTKQEGQEFTYTDFVSKADPVKTQFSMNAILGSVNLTLSTAVPAKMLDVEFDQSYVISVNSGYYTPCPQCSDDAWFASFKSRPSSYNGTGLQSSGYTTSRDTYSNNLSNGNYEDTIFGRACWLPPTMIPLTHKKNIDLNTQRRSRLLAQSALYINGYQRDWFGFNQGALIGSFNGVNWFAIGKGRRITSTSEKLFLAINAPFSDLADKTDILVNVVTDQGGGTTADFDYDPALAINDARQNQGGSCQANHMCNTDSDCVSRLGWEYRCADIGQHKSKWPTHDLTSEEQGNEETESLNFAKIIEGPRASGSNRRCVYRGMGAICSQNVTALSDSDKKLFQCAPNFYCASLEESEFNDELVRSPNEISNILFGREANILGRPKNYIAGNTPSNLQSTLKVNTDGTHVYDGSTPPSEVILEQIRHNTSLYASFDPTSAGLCRPSKDIAASTQTDMQTAKDILERTDYISQISSCDSSQTVFSNRTRSCPVIDDDPNSATYLDYIENPSAAQTNIQNMCGAASQAFIGGELKSVFFEIEADTLLNQTGITQPMFAKDACLRKAGAVCQTDLDCGPNKMHAQTALFYDQTHFGNTEAEHKYWQEYLVCGQAQKQPSFTDPNFADYDITKNRCCRETGKALTMFTEGDSSVLPSNVSSPGLNTVLSDSTPSSNGRYSRYSVVEDPSVTSNLLDPPTNQRVRVEDGTNAGVVPKRFQWKTMNDTAQRTCCGRGWVRKFADGTNDWTKKDRLSINPVDFACLNTKSSIPFTTDPLTDLNVQPDTYYSEYSRVCIAPADNNGCIQNPIKKSLLFEIEAPTNESGSTSVLSTVPDEDPSSGTLLQVNSLSVDVPYMPSPYNKQNAAATGPYNYFASPDFGQKHVSFVLPVYISASEVGANIRSNRLTNISVRKFTGGGETYSGTLAHETHVGAITAVSNLECSNGAKTFWPAESSWCLQIHDNKVIFKANISKEATTNTVTDGDADNNYDYAGVEIGFVRQYTGVATEPGNDLYYLTKLAKLELLGIPQILYEPLYCNSDREQLIPGIYEDTTRTQVHAGGSKWFNYNGNPGIENNYHDIYESSYSDPNGLTRGATNTKVTHANGIAQAEIWSDSEFMCCLNLGEETDDPGMCCSGFAAQVGTGPDQKNICKLPSGTNLHVYFNKFVSGDGMGEDQPGGGLEDADFVPETGEIKMSNDVLTKVSALGAEYCSSGTVRGGAAFGFFYAEPNTGSYFQNGDLEDSKMWSIVDSNLDYDDANDTGFVRFLDGFRWNHHIYCD